MFFSLGDPLLASVLGSLSSKQESSPFCATRRRYLPAGVLVVGAALVCQRVRLGSCIPAGQGTRFQTKDPVLLTRQVPGSVKKPGICFRERVQPNLTNPSCTDILPLPTRTLIAFYPKEQYVKGAEGLIALRGTLRSQTTLNEVSV